MNSVSERSGLDPSDALRAGRFDPTALLVLWCLRKAFLPILWIGLIMLTIRGETGRINEIASPEDLIATFTSFTELAAAILSPLVGVLVAIVLRLFVAFAASALAYPLSRSNERDNDAGEGRFRLVWDRWYRTRAFVALRWTWAVRQAAVERLGQRGTRLAACDPILRWMGILLFLALIASTAITGRP